MTDNKDEEHLYNPPNTESPNPSGVIIPTNDMETNKSNQEIENMEAPKHPHHITHKKKWTEYLLEFFMLFLAVFLGFVAENVREDNKESRTAKEYMQAYKLDLIRNQGTIHTNDNLYISLIPVYDSICNIYYTKRENIEIKRLERLLYEGKRSILTLISTPTYAQLLNSGGLKNIPGISLRDNMAAYYDAINNLRDYDLRMMQLKNPIYPGVIEIEDLHSFWKPNAADPENPRGLIPDMDLFEPMTRGQRRVIINYYRQFFIQMRADHSLLIGIMRMNKNLVDQLNKQ